MCICAYLCVFMYFVYLWTNRKWSITAQSKTKIKSQHFTKLYLLAQDKNPIPKRHLSENISPGVIQ